MLFETYGVDKLQVGVEDVLRSLTVEGTDKKRNDALGDHRVAVGGKK